MGKRSNDIISETLRRIRDQEEAQTRLDRRARDQDSLLDSPEERRARQLEDDMGRIEAAHPRLVCTRCDRGPLTKRRQWVIADKRKVDISTGEEKTETAPDYRSDQSGPVFFIVCRRCWMKKFGQGSFSEANATALARVRAEKEASRRVTGWLSRLKSIAGQATGLRVTMDFIISPMVIRGLREMVGASQNRFAEALGIDRMMLRRYESSDEDRIVVPLFVVNRLVEAAVAWPTIADDQDTQDDIRVFALLYIYPNMSTLAGTVFEGPGGEEAVSRAQLLVEALDRDLPETMDELYGPLLDDEDDDEI